VPDGGKVAAGTLAVGLLVVLAAGGGPVTVMTSEVSCVSSTDTGTPASARCAVRSDDAAPAPNDAMFSAMLSADNDSKLPVERLGSALLDDAASEGTSIVYETSTEPSCTRRTDV